MKNFLIKLFGQTAVNGASAIWCWLWGMPIRSGGELSVAAGEAAIANQADAVKEMTEAVGAQQAAVRQITETLEYQNSQAANLENRISALLESGNKGDEHAAEQLAAQLLPLQTSIPDLEKQLVEAQTNFERARENLRRQKTILTQMKAQQKSNAATAAVTAAIESANRKMAEMDGVNGTSTMEKATEAIKARSNRATGISDAQSFLTESDRALERSETQALLDRFRK